MCRFLQCKHAYAKRKFKIIEIKFLFLKGGSILIMTTTNIHMQLWSKIIQNFHIIKFQKKNYQNIVLIPT